MPELPEVETVRRGLAPAMEGARFLAVEVRRPDLRRPFPNDFRERVEGRTLVALRRRAKYLLGDLDSGDVLLMHLGMSGSFRIEREEGAAVVPGAYYHAKSEAKAHDHVVFHMSSGARIVFNDPRRFGLMLVVAGAELSEHPLMREIGPEPLSDGFDARTLARACAGKATSLKAALLDQCVVAGLGNIYVCEALHRAGISPRRSAATLATKGGAPTARAAALVEAIKAVLAEAIAAGGSSLRDHRQTDGTLGLFQHRFRVYDREGEPCVTSGCAGTVRRIVQGGRSTFFCPVCQK
ncbi:Formamidopyrimidine-DNA glycosylase [Rhodovulum sp. PH10]|uniref:bifunctional DNA-formamidopyrimidine glycosylase/DNA-(apurinic or apyrimidinic site) lyase n=1 Tax=Rhodovulum sp. PH10 TaxID=1187851 RepID=UPI00027C225C|nr:bifunctional DNA-formamidopyrimidine glycosylase/DNA-(apurinic or apyrimidinic site) lyase [Rhodovulum sp. PH10]EJW09598.1 Formamidopyrimidine-DNA glycosylase [Rhodovulum sp. PH10]